MAADPTAAELATLVDVKATMVWAGFPEAGLADETTVEGSFLKHLGITPDARPRVIGIFNDGDLMEMLNKWKVPGGGAPRVPSLGEAGKARLFFRACQLVAGTGATLDELRNQLAAAKAAPTPSPPTTAPAGSPSRKMKLNTIISQIDDTELVIAEEKDILKCYANYESVFGSGERPSKDCEPTVEQITGLMHVVGQGSPPYADFSIFGPFGHRMMKRIKLSGYTLDRDGSLKTMEMYGPNNLTAWLQSFNVLMTVLIMIDAVDLGHLQKYKAHIERLAERYGVKVWSIVYQADVRCRLEHMERLKRDLVAEHEKITNAGGTSTFNPKRPWNAVFAKAIADETFWREEVVEPCMMVITRISNASEILDGDAKIGGSSSSAAGPRDPGAVPAKMAPANEKQTPRPRNTNRTGRVHQIQDGKYVMNRTGYALCAGYNTEQCTGNGLWCHQAWDTVHQCNRCLGGHPATKCPHSEIQTPNFVKNASKGKGRGKSGRGGGKGKRPQY